MVESNHEASIVVACDMPFLNPRLLRFMLESSTGADATVAQIGGVIQPLHTVYQRSALGVMKDCLATGDTSPARLLARLNTRVILEGEVRAIDPDLRSFFSVNTPEDLARARAIVSSE
jgi:molybdopterin-guanine dinucleotide biosynthesis protein A